jgi:hypothetical protein
MRDGFRIYDTHTHVGAARHSGRNFTAEDLLRSMDNAGVDRSLAIPFPVVEDHRAAHDEIGRAAKAHPDRIAGAACLYPYMPEREYRDEVRRCRELYGFRALKLQPQYHALNPLWKSAAFLFECALEHRMTLIVHTGSGLPYSLPAMYMLPARQYPELKIVLAHCGGGIFLGEAIVAASFCPNIYIELSSLMPHQVHEALGAVPASRLMIGSDLPESLETEMSKILRLDIAGEAKRDILWDTACSVFGEAP